MTVNELAGRYGVSPDDLRNYENMGLLTPPREDGIVIYGVRECLRLEVILRAQRLDIPLYVLKELIDGLRNGRQKRQ